MESDSYGLPTIFSSLYDIYLSHMGHVSLWLYLMYVHTQAAVQNASYVLLYTFSVMNSTLKLYQVTCSILFSLSVLITISLLFWRHRVFYYNQFFGVHLKSIHQWKPFQSSSHPKYCSGCGQLICGFYIYRNTGWECLLCARTAHLNCLPGCDRFPCKTPSQPMPVHHQFIKGNLAADSACCVCGIVCSSHFGLNGLRCLWCNRTLHEDCKLSLPELCDFGPFRHLIVPPFVVELIHKDDIAASKISPSKYMGLMGVHLRESLQHVRKAMSASFKERLETVSAGMKRINAVIIHQFRRRHHARWSRYAGEPSINSSAAAPIVNLVTTTAQDNGSTTESASHFSIDTSEKVLSNGITSPYPQANVHEKMLAKIDYMDFAAASKSSKRLLQLHRNNDALVKRFFNLLKGLTLSRTCNGEYTVYLPTPLYKLFHVKANSITPLSVFTTSFGLSHMKEEWKALYRYKHIIIRSQANTRYSRITLFPLCDTQRPYMATSSTKRRLKQIAHTHQYPKVELSWHRRELGAYSSKRSSADAEESIRIMSKAFVMQHAHQKDTTSWDILRKMKLKHALLRTEKKIKSIPAKETERLYELAKKMPVKANVWQISKEVDTLLKGAHVTPLLVFVNTKSGGQTGSSVFREFVTYMNPIQVIDIQDEKGPSRALKMFRPLAMSNRLRIVVCGGDGTVGWVINELHKLYGAGFDWHVPIGILPLGTGNDLSKILGWGISFDGDLSKFLHKIQTASTSVIDIWYVQGMDAKGNTVLSTTFQNYVEFGVVARVALKFHELREAHPELFQSRIGNKFLYGEVGVRSFFVNSNLMLKDVKIWCDGEEVEFPESPIEDICIINIPSFAGGVNLWKSATSTPYDTLEMDTPFDVRRHRSWAGAMHNGDSSKKNPEYTMPEVSPVLPPVASQPIFSHIDSTEAPAVRFNEDLEWDSTDVYPQTKFNNPAIFQHYNLEKMYLPDRFRSPVTTTREYNVSSYHITPPSTDNFDFSFANPVFDERDYSNYFNPSKGEIRKLSDDSNRAKCSTHRWKKQSIKDQLIEVVAFKSLIHMAQVQVGLAEPLRLCQGQEVTITLPQSLPCQIDGEPETLSPCTLKITHKFPAFVLTPSDRSQNDTIIITQQVLNAALKKNIISNFQRNVLLREFYKHL